MEVTKVTQESTFTHVLFLLHGLWGWPDHMFAVRDALLAHAREHQASVNVYCCESYQGTRAYDGVDVCADRVVDEVHGKMKALRDSGRQVDKFSILGYSLGGLIARVVVQRLHVELFFDNVQPCNFTTFASPAIGIPKIGGIIPNAIQATSAFFLSRTGTHLYLRDRRKETGRPLVYDMATSEFTRALAIFQNVNIYANTVGDRVVPYLTGGISTVDPFLPALGKARGSGSANSDHVLMLDKIELTFDTEYPVIITDVRVVDSHSVASAKTESTPTSAITLVKPGVMTAIRPWFNASTYPFLPRPLNYLLVVLIPLVVPAVLLVVGTFTFQRTASVIRVHRHFRHHKRAAPKEVVRDEIQEEHNQTPDLEAQADDSETLRSPMGISPATTFAGTITTSVNVDLSGVYSTTSSPSLPQIQKDMVRMLDESVHMRKHLAFIPNVFTSHPIIICRDQDIPAHRLGLSAVRHWASNFLF